MVLMPLLSRLLTLLVILTIDRKSGSAGMPRPTSYAVFCLKKKSVPEDAIVQMRVSPQARNKLPALPEYWRARAIEVIDPQGRKKVLLTSLTDRKQFKAAEIVACYARRWQIETSYRELKQSMMGMALTLR